MPWPATPREDWSAEDYASILSYRPRHLTRGMISVSDTPPPSTIQRDASSSSIGLLDQLPLELLHCTFSHLDFRTLSHLSRVSLRGKATVESLRAYRDLVQHAPHTLKALGQTGLINFHTAFDLQAVLQTEECVVCQQYGPFLFLPTCERCCFECLNWNPSLWVVPVALASKAFNLSSYQLKGAPIFRSIPGTYRVEIEISRQRTLRLVSVKFAKELGMTIHGSKEEIVKSHPPRNTIKDRQSAVHEWYMLKQLLEAPVERPGPQPSTLQGRSNTGNDRYCGMASIQFPTLLASGALDHGHWCKACLWFSMKHGFGTMSPAVQLLLAPDGGDASRVLVQMERRARSKTEMLEHATNCYGVHAFIQSLERGARTSGRPMTALLDSWFL